MDERAFSPDGYITCQAFTKEYAYGMFTSDYNGCGWIAIYNLMKVLNRHVTFEQVWREMNQILPYAGVVGTPFRTMKKYLKVHGISAEYVRGKNQVIKRLQNRNCGIFRYIEGIEPHYVAFTRQADGTRRFFNIGQGSINYICKIENFFSMHIKLPYIKAILIIT